MECFCKVCTNVHYSAKSENKQEGTERAKEASEALRSPAAEPALLGD
jgi:hypothetical protein